MKFFTLFLTLITLSLPAKASEEFDYTHFNQIPILENGRVKPLGVFAKQRLENLSGHNQNAAAWLAKTLFDPATAIEEPIFEIKSNALKTRFKLNEDQTIFTLNDLEPGIKTTLQDAIALLQIDQNELIQNTLAKEQKEFIKLHEDALSHTQLLRSFSMLLPLNVEVPEQYQNAAQTYLELRPLEQRIEQDLKAIIRERGEDFERYNAAQKSIALLGFQLRQIREGGTTNKELRVIPVEWEEGQWAAPWELLNSGGASPQTKEFLQNWGKLAAAYRANDATAWNTLSQDILQNAHALSGHSITPTRLKTEILYQSIKPYHWAMILYALSIVLFIVSTQTNRHPRFTRGSCAHNNQIPDQVGDDNFSMGMTARAALTTGLIALTLHITAIIARIYILARPPVGTLYESVLFVSAICAAIGLFLCLKSKSTILPITGQAAALGLLAIAPVMLQGSDSLELLVAVLNTNFWLAVHVLCITAGYAVCILAACLAHGYLFIRIKNTQHKILPTLYKTTYKTSLVALLLTAVGTVLGGIWADQSWGRFWGWDPKENGALFIVLWLIWLQHGRLSGHIRDLPFMAGMAALNIIVALAWFGVNLLNVGLHSYGFTSGIAEGLAIFCTLETLIILGAWAAIRLRERRPA